jgi:DNA (cytosine-5)-methyltransferase 1
MKFLELFAGIGGFRLGLEKAGHQCVWANEFVPKAASIYEHNFKDKPDGRDIRTIHVDEIPDADLLVGGFPCATFSIAGKRTGFGTEDTRGTLFFEICRLLAGKRIPYLFLENVKGLLNHDGGRTFGVIVASLDELGYDVQWECLNSKNFGVPQSRERVFIVGNLRDRPRPQVFPLGRCYSADGVQDGTQQAAQSRVQAADHKKFAVGTLLHRLYAGDTNNVYIEDGVCREAFNSGYGYTRGGQAVGSFLRQFTPLECERLQSLPDNWTKWYADSSLVPDSQRYERCGRAVTVNVIHEIAKRLPL